MAAGGWRRAGGKAACRRRAFIHHRGKEVRTLCIVLFPIYFYSVPFIIGQQSSQTSLTLLLGALRRGRSVNTKTAAAAVASKKGKPAEPAYDAAQIQARTASALRISTLHAPSVACGSPPPLLLGRAARRSLPGLRATLELSPCARCWRALSRCESGQACTSAQPASKGCTTWSPRRASGPRAGHPGYLGRTQRLPAGGGQLHRRGAGGLRNQGGGGAGFRRLG